ncbi:MAG: 4Fe-4S ferredoxin [Deltaproteobacteria bacterium]|nr:4Fe-4S ferredoxin [Candidatus Zymogenaceae bacterium]
MYVDQDLCRKCADCLPICPVGAFEIRNKKIVINYDSCVECGVCLRSGICTEGAIKQVDEIPYPRIIRAAFSDPLHHHESTEVLGRGTEEMKTNDVKDEFTEGNVGFSLELGRPGVATKLSELDKVTREVISLGGEFATYNPVLSLMENPDTGALKSEVLGERVLSAIAEFIVPRERAMDVLGELVTFINHSVDTVVTVSLIARNDENGGHSLLDDLKKLGQELGFNPYPNGKVNVGMALVR